MDPRDIYQRMYEQDPEAFHKTMQEAQNMEQRMQESFQNSGDRDYVIHEHNQRRQDAISHSSNEKDLVYFTDPIQDAFASKKSSAGSKKSEKQCRPILLSELTLNRTHKGRVLKGTLIVDPWVMKAIQTIIEDSNGDFLKVSIYFPPIDHLPLSQKMSFAESKFAQGQQIAIIEPFYKQAMDYSLIIRVDDINEVKFIADIQPESAEEYKARGNSHFSKKQYNEAIQWYDKAVEVMSGINEAKGIMLSISMVQSQAYSDYQTALTYAVAVAMISKGRSNGMANDLAYAYVRELRNKFPELDCSTDSVIINDESVLMLVASHLEGNPAAENPTKVSGSMTNVLNLKQQGNDYFEDGNYDMANYWYFMALAIFDYSQEYLLSTILSNRSVCLQNLGNHLYAAVDAAISIVIRPLSVKAHYRRIQSLLSLNLEQQSISAYKVAQGLFPGNHDILTLQNQVNSVQNLKENPSQTSKRISNLRQPKVEAIYATVEELQANLQAFKASGLDIIDDRVKSFHIKFADLAQWPKDCPIEACRRYLWSCYEHSRSRFNECQIEKEFPVDVNEQELRARIGPADQKTVNWYRKRILKSVHFRRMRWDYTTVQSYGNCPKQKLRLPKNSTHVAIGFADLGELCIAELENKVERWRDRPLGWPDFRQIVSYLEGKDGTVRWIGYEQSHYSIAKTLVILQMMKENCEIDSILQVWYSSAWSYATLASFRDAIQHCPLDSQPVEVQQLLQVWAVEDVPLSIARKAWLEDHQVPNTDLANFIETKDQISFCQYLISGQLLSADVGSITMYVIPENIGILSQSENIFEVLDLLKLLERTDEQGDIVAAAIATLREQIQTLQQRIQNKDVTVKVRFGTVEPQTNILQEIKDLKPKSISWNNLCDYFSPQEFGDILRTLQQDEHPIKHYMYSMNWTRTIFGSSIIDYKDTKTRKQILQRCKNRLQVYYDAIGYSKYLHSPPIGNAFNFTDWSLQTDLYKTWMSEFESECGISFTSIGTVSKRPFAITNRSNCTIEVIFNF